MNAIDTNVLVYAVDESEPTKQAKAINLLETLSAQPVRLVGRGGWNCLATTS